ncbi:MAG TPA: calcium-binding protein, partial [Actinomycetota bacterium]|nr:calcium-binding protein [Actinomycetota bacterium]
MLIRRLTPLVLALMLGAIASPVAAATGTRTTTLRAVQELSDHFQITAQAFDGAGTVEDPADIHKDDQDEFDQQVGASDGPAGSTRKASSTTVQDTKVSAVGSNLGLQVATNGAVDAEYDDGDVTDDDFPFARGDSEFRIAVDVTGQEAAFSLSGSASASSTGVGLDGRGEALPCSMVNVGVPDGTIASVATPSRCGSPASSQLKITGTLAPGQHEFTVSAVAQVRSQPTFAHHGHAQVQFDLTLIVADCDVVGTPGADHLEGTPGADVICGMGGRDTIEGDGGNDTLIGGAQVDTMLGGPGADTIQGFAGDDVIRGGENDDHIFAGDGCDDASGDDGNDEIFGGDEDVRTRTCDKLAGGPDDDHIVSGDGRARLEGGPGSDTIEGGGDFDLIFDEAGPNALLSGGGGGDGICGSPQRDVIHGGAGDDFLTGNDGFDTITGDVGGDIVSGGAGGFKAGGHPVCLPPPGASDVHDELSGGPGIDELSGDSGGDTLNGGPQHDTLDGDADGDTINACDAAVDDVDG